MAPIHALEAVCDLLVYFALASIFPAYSNAGLLIGAVLLLTAASSLILEKLNKMPARVLCGLLPALSLFAAQTTAHVLFTIPALCIWFSLAVSGKNAIHYNDYKYWFGIPALLAPILLFVSLSRSISSLPVSLISVLCTSAYLAIGIIVLRRKRLGAGTPASTRFLNVAEIVVAASGGVLACAVLWQLLKVSGKVLEKLFYVGGVLIGAFARLVSWIMSLFTKAVPVEIPDAAETTTALETGYVSPEELKPDTAPKNYGWAETAGRVIVILLILALIALTVFLAYKAIKRIRRRAVSDDPQYETSSREKSARLSGRDKKRKRDQGTNRSKIRKIYREYLSYIKLNGVRIVRNTTSEEALAASKQLAESAEAEELRALYIRARYNENDPVGDEEVRRAKELWDMIRSEYEENRKNSLN